MLKPYAESCEQNKDPIFNVIEPYLRDKKSVLEIGSGTGQHAVYFAQKLLHLIWHTSDRLQYHDGITRWLNDAGLGNIKKPVVLDVSHSTWPQISVDVVYSANTTHIMHWQDVEALFEGVGHLLNDAGLFFLYGPFNFSGKFSSESNRRFDQHLKSCDSLSGIRNFEDLNTLAELIKLKFIKKHKMPCNNHILVWEKYKFY